MLAPNTKLEHCRTLTTKQSQSYSHHFYLNVRDGHSREAIAIGMGHGAQVHHHNALSGED